MLSLNFLLCPIPVIFNLKRHYEKLLKNVILRYGTLPLISSDQGRDFASKVIRIRETWESRMETGYRDLLPQCVAK